MLSFLISFVAAGGYQCHQSNSAHARCNKRFDSYGSAPAGHRRRSGSHNSRSETSLNQHIGRLCSTPRDAFVAALPSKILIDLLNVHTVSRPFAAQCWSVDFCLHCNVLPSFASLSLSPVFGSFVFLSLLLSLHTPCVCVCVNLSQSLYHASQHGSTFFLFISATTPNYL